jgi:hypothetical protein
VRSLSNLAISASQAESTDEVWLMLLEIDHADILDGPLRMVNDMQDLYRAPASNLLTVPDIGLWTPANSGSITRLGGSLYRLTDTDAAQYYQVTTGVSGLNSGLTYTFMARIRKDAVPAATRQVGFNVSSGGPWCYLLMDTSTGELNLTSSGGTISYGHIDAGDAWLVYVTMTGTTVFNIAINPAQGAGTLGSYSVAAQGSCLVERPCLFAGTVADLEHYIAFPFQIDLPSEDTEQPSSARLKLDNVDRSIVEAIRGLSSAPTGSFEVVLASQPEVVEAGFYDLTIRSADYDALYVEAALTFEQIYTEPVTVELTPARAPGLF